MRFLFDPGVGGTAVERTPPMLLVHRVDPDIALPLHNDVGIPYGAAMAADGSCWYVDRRIPEWWEHAGRRWRIWKYLFRHEFHEWKRMLNGEHYSTAHPAAEGDEHAALRADGADQATVDAYEAFLKPLLDGCAADARAGRMRDIPADIYTGPYRDSNEMYLLEPTMLKALRPEGESNGVNPGDEVYFRHNAGDVRYGRVTRRGKDGFCCKSEDGEIHRVVHDRYVAHRTRVAQHAVIEDEGEDGILARLPTGPRIFIRHPEEEETASKAMFLLKAGPIKGRPGLVLTQVSDKRGHQTQRWKSTGAQQQPNPKRAAALPEHSRVAHAAVGDHINFEGGKGEVTARGADGVTVKGTDGNIHHVRNDAIGARRFDAAAHGRSKMSPDKVAGFSKLVDEPSKKDEHTGVTDEKSAYDSARVGLKQFARMLTKRGGLADKLHAEVFINDSDAAKQHMEDHPHDTVLMLAPLKGAGRAKEKAEKTGWGSVKDLVRGSIVVPTLDDVPKALKAIKASGLKMARVKNRFDKPTPGGYRDMLLNVELPNGHIADLQVHITPMLLAKEAYGGHKHYENIRGLVEDKIEQNVPLEPDEQAHYDKEVGSMERVYNHAWKHAYKG